MLWLGSIQLLLWLGSIYFLSVRILLGFLCLPALVYLTPKKGANRPTLHNRLYHHRPPGGFQNQTGNNLLTIPSLEITITYHHIPSQGIRHHQGRSETIRDHNEPLKNIADHQGPSGTLRDPQGPSGILRDLRDPQGQDPCWENNMID